MRLLARLARAVALPVILLGATLSAAQAAAPPATVDGGPVVLTGIDAEDGGVGGHGPIETYARLVGNILAGTSNGGAGILVIGANDTGPQQFWTAIGSHSGQTITFGAPDATLEGFRMIAVVGSAPETAGGLTAEQNAVLTGRQTEVAQFVNNGGGLLGNTQADFASPYGYVGGLAAITAAAVPQYQAIEPTQDGLAVGIDASLSVCCWHNVFTTFPAFLRPLAFDAELAGRPAAAIGGRDVLIPVGIELTPPTAEHRAGEDHTVTATVQDGNSRPRAEVPVTFRVVEGPNAGVAGSCAPDTSCRTAGDGTVAFTYRGGESAGTDQIEACFPNATTGRPACATATAVWIPDPPVPVVTPAELDFGDQPVGRTSGPLPIVVSNGGGGRLAVGAITAAEGFTVDDGCADAVLTAGQTCTALVRVTPPRAGALTGTVTVPGAEPVAVRVNGATTVLAVTPNPADLGGQPVGTGGAGRLLTVRNTGSVPVRITGVRITGVDAASFGQTAELAACPLGEATLAPDATCVVGVDFHPDRLGGHAATLEIDAVGRSGDEITTTVPLAGTGLTGGLVAVPGQVRFAPEQVGRDSPPNVVILRNVDAGRVRLDSVALTGAGRGAFGLDIGTCAGVTLTAGQTCLLRLNLHPDDVGPVAATLTVTSGDLAEPVLVPVSGVGVAAELTVSPAVGPPGTVVRVTGAGFPPGAATVVWEPGLGGTSVTVAADGTLTGTVLVMPRDRLGTRSMVVTSLSGVSAKASVLVTPPVAAPPFSIDPD